MYPYFILTLNICVNKCESNFNIYSLNTQVRASLSSCFPGVIGVGVPWLDCPLQCHNTGHNGHGINLYGVLMILTDNLHADRPGGLLSQYTVYDHAIDLKPRINNQFAPVANLKTLQLYYREFP